MPSGGARKGAGRKEGVRTATTHIMQIRLQQEDYRTQIKMAEAMGTKPATRLPHVRGGVSLSSLSRR